MPGKIMLVAGARPNFMKVAPLLECLNRRPEFRPILVHTGQHYDSEMSDIFFVDLNLPKPDVYLGVGSSSHSAQTARIMVAFEQVLVRQQPEFVMVVGDVNSTLACALVTAKTTYRFGKRPKLAHVEAGLRSFDRTMPEEINRIVTDALSDLLFTTSQDAVENLRNEGIKGEKVFFVGNVMIDTLFAYRERAEGSSILDRLGLTNGSGKQPASYAICTLHRPSNVDDMETFVDILGALREIGREMPIIYPMHPRSRQRLQEYGLSHYVSFSRSTEPIHLSDAIICVEPLGYLDFLKLMGHSRFVITDSGGIQEETTILGIPCVTVRENTERPVTISQGTNILAGVKKEAILRAASCALDTPGEERRVPEKWDGKAAERIVKVLLTGKLDA